MAKLNTKIRYLCQDYNGAVHASINTRPIIKNIDTVDNAEWLECDFYSFDYGKVNPNWRNTLIDLDVDDYEFEDGILRRIEK